MMCAWMSMMALYDCHIDMEVGMILCIKNMWMCDGQDLLHVVHCKKTHVFSESNMCFLDIQWCYMLQ